MSVLFSFPVWLMKKRAETGRRGQDGGSLCVLTNKRASPPFVGLFGDSRLSVHLGEREGGGGEGRVHQGFGAHVTPAPLRTTDVRASRAGGWCTSACSRTCLRSSFLTSSPAVCVYGVCMPVWAGGGRGPAGLPPPPTKPEPGLDPTRAARLPLCSPPADNPHVYLMLTCCLC